jgi:hypothetical protein
MGSGDAACPIARSTIFLSQPPKNGKAKTVRKKGLRRIQLILKDNEAASKVI